MRNIKLTIQYEGTNYAGWQFQKNARSIQQVIQETLNRITGEKVNVIASGRTDSGVHALAQAANFRTHSNIPLNKLQMALNSYLPKDIVITKIAEASKGFNAQHDAASKIYCYSVVNGDFVSPFLRRYASRCFFPLDIGKMKRAAKYLAGRHDFKAFQATDDTDKNSVRTVISIKIRKDPDALRIYMEADGFLYNMARNIAGTLIEVGRGKFSVDQAKEILEKRQRRLCGPTAPAKGLCLVKVKY